MRVINDLSALAHELAQAVQKRERRLCVLSGTETTTEMLLSTIESTASKTASDLPVCYFSFNSEFKKGDGQHAESGVAHIDEKNYRQWLGRESRLLVFDGGLQWNPDVFAALAGTVVAGGLVLFIVRENKSLNSNSSQHFHHYFLNQLASDTKTLQLTADEFDNEFSEQHFITQVSQQLTAWAQNKGQVQITESLQSDGLSATAEQLEAVEQIIKVNRGHRDRPLVLTADRGRGKSTALAIACVRLLRLYQEDSAPRQFIICAPQKKSLSVFYQHLLHFLPEAKVEGHSVSYGHHSLRFIPIDELLQNPLPCHLLLIDEAAGFPVPLLTQLLANYHRIVFCSTIHGYEGAGRGFTLKFLSTLAKQNPQFRQLHIKAPIRWAENDPVERCLNRALLLDAELPKILASQLQQAQSVKASIALGHSEEVVIVKGAELINQPERLAQVFSLLVIAHYQTKPSDLKLLLDEPDNTVVMLYRKEQLIGAALLVTEGAIEPELTAAVATGKRRLKGNLVPQTLATQAGFTNLMSDKFLRVMRIAVHPELQSCGAGSRLLLAVRKYAQSQAVDWLGVSFGANVSLVNFWLDNQYHFVRLGVSRDAASGEYAATMLQPLTTKAEQVIATVCQRYWQDFTYLVSGHFSALNVELAITLARSLSKTNGDSAHVMQAQFDFAEAYAFTNGHRQLQHCAPALARVLWRFIYSQSDSLKISGSSFNGIEWQLAFQYLIQQQNGTAVIKQCQLTGKKQLQTKLQDFFRQQLAKLKNEGNDV